MVKKKILFLRRNIFNTFKSCYTRETLRYLFFQSIWQSKYPKVWIINLIVYIQLFWNNNNLQFAQNLWHIHTCTGWLTQSTELFTRVFSRGTLLIRQVKGGNDAKKHISVVHGLNVHVPSTVILFLLVSELKWNSSGKSVRLVMKVFSLLRVHVCISTGSWASSVPSSAFRFISAKPEERKEEECERRKEKNYNCACDYDCTNKKV